MIRPRRAARTRGVSAVEYIVVLLMLAISVVGVHKLFGAKVKCKVTTALNVFGGEGSAACNESNPPVALNGPPAANCFIAGTLVTTELGPRPIESLAVGIRVLARAESGGELAWKPVVTTFVSRSRSLVRLKLASATHVETLEVTPNHRMHVLDRGWLPAGELVPGEDALVDESGEALELLDAQSLPDQVPVYNLEVADFHTYFVGELNVWVHNRAPDPPGDVEPATGQDPPAIVVRRRHRRRPVIFVDPPDEPTPPRVPTPPPPVESPPAPPPRVPTPPPASPPPSPGSSPPSPGSSPPASPVEPASPGAPLLQGFNQQIWDNRMNRPGSLWAQDQAGIAAAQANAEAAAERAQHSLEVAQREYRAAQARLQRAKRQSRTAEEEAQEKLWEAQEQRDQEQRLYDQLHAQQQRIGNYESGYMHETPPSPDSVVGTLTIHAGPNSANPAVLSPNDVMNGAVGHSWVSFQANGDNEPAHLPFSLWNDAQSGQPTTLGFFPENRGGVDRYGRAPGQLMIPDPVSQAWPGTSNKTYPLTQGQLDNLLIYLDAKKDAPYSLCTHNCTTWAAGAVAATGNTPPPSSWMGIASPNALHNGITKENGAAAPPEAGGGCG